MAEKIGGAKKQKEEAHAIKHPETGEAVVATKEIKRLSLEHCVRVLKNNPVEPNAKQWVQIESETHDAMMEDNKDKDSNIDKEEFDEVLKKFKLKNKPTYKFLINAGESFKTSIFKLCRRLI